MHKNVLAYILLPTILLLVHFKAADFSVRCLRWIWRSKNPSGVMLLARWTFVAVVTVLLLVPFGLPAIPAVAFAFVTAMVHGGAMIYITQEWIRDHDA
jgi:hypothetical protein